MEKLSAAQQREVLEEMPQVLRKVAAERDFYLSELLKLEDRARVEKIASAMIEKGLREGKVSDVADDLEKQASAGDIDLTVTSRAVELVGPDMGKRASVSNDESSGAAGSSDFERYITQG
jgi:hypothetical protein